MIYLQDNDINALMQVRLKNESMADHTTALDEIEAQNIEVIKSYLGNRYDMAIVFDEDNPIRNAVIVRLLTQLCLYDLVRRNAARKVPSDYKDEYDKAMSLLLKINSGQLKLDGLPLTTGEDGEVLSTSIYANNRNENYFL